MRLATTAGADGLYQWRPRSVARPAVRGAGWPTVIEICDSPDDAVRGVAAGSTVLISGFGDAGLPAALVDALLRTGAGDLTIVSNNAGTGSYVNLGVGQQTRVADYLLPEQQVVLHTENGPACAAVSLVPAVEPDGERREDRCSAAGRAEPDLDSERNYEVRRSV